MKTVSIRNRVVAVFGGVALFALAPQFALAMDAQLEKAVAHGKDMFYHDTFGGNGRVCESCHSDGGKRPGIVYLHGGGYSTGSAGSVAQDGARLAAVYDVVVVAPNHRLGLLGYLWLGDLLGGDYATGNASMNDIVASLEWVRDNVAAFGGDPNNVTVFGESGGGGKVATLLGMPAAKGLFHKAGIESGAQLRRMPRAFANETAKRLLRALNLDDPRKLFAISARTLLALQWVGARDAGPLAQPTPGFVQPPVPKMMPIAFTENTVPGHFGPVIDGTSLPADPFDPVATPLCADVPLLIASNHTEAAFFFMNEPEVFEMDRAALDARMRHDFGDKAERIRRQKRRRSRRAKQRMLADKSHQAEKKAGRRRIDRSED